MDRPTLKTAAYRSALLAAVGGFLMGWPGAVIGLVAAPLAVVEAWGRRRPRSALAFLEVLVIAWVVAFTVIMAGLFQYLYTAALVAGQDD